MTTYNDCYQQSLEYFNGDEIAANVFLTKYALVNPESGDILEPTPDLMHKRLAKEFARIEAKYSNPMSEEEIYGLLKNFKYVIPQGSPMAGIGNPYQVTSLSNCFLAEMPLDSYGSIMHTDQQLAQISKRRGGVGIDLSNIRPKGLPTKNASKTTDGIALFMERFSNTIREVGQAGRRGALMQTLSVHHPEIETFIKIKRDLKKVTGANISIRLSDAFLQAVEDGTDYVVQFPVGEPDPAKCLVYKHISARALWAEIMDSAWQSAEPGLLFWDTVIKRSPADCYADVGYKTVSTNPCITKDSWIMTDVGPRQVEQLIGKPFNAIVNGKAYRAKPGFVKTGFKKVFEVKTKHGFTVKATDNHKFKTPTGWVGLGSLAVGDSLVLNNHTGFEWSGNGTRDEGWLLGNLLGDGTFAGFSRRANLCYWGETKMHMVEHATQLLNNVTSCRSDLGSSKSEIVNDNKCKHVTSRGLHKLALNYLLRDKQIGRLVEESSSDFHAGFLSGWFDADGTVIGTNKKGISVRLGSVNLENLYAAQRMLARLGIVSNIYENRKLAQSRLMPNGHNGESYYECQAFHELVISKNNINVFKSKIGFADPNKTNKLNNLVAQHEVRGLYKETYLSPICSITELGFEDVYDTTVDEVHEFDANGISVHNCSELTLSELDSCRLMLQNLASFVSNPFTKEAAFDFELFKTVSYKAQRLMDDMVDLELEKIQLIIDKVKSDPEPDYIKAPELSLWEKIYKTAENGRRTGLGITALGDTLAYLGLRYGSDESIKMTEEIYRTLAIASYKASVDMAEERGAFPVYSYDKEKNHEFILDVMNEDLELKAKWAKFGRRNIANLTTAPAGSVSIECQTTSGIEPAFMVQYKRRKKITNSDEVATVDFIDDLGDKWQEFTVYHHGFKKWMEVTGLTAYEDSPYFKSMSGDVDWEAKVRLQGAAQKWVDHAISCTVNVPNETTVETVQKIYSTGWKSGCKGLTIYRDGSRSGVLIADEPKKEVPTKALVDHFAPKRPEILPCDIYHFTVKGEKWNAFVGLYEGRPYEIFAGRAEYIAIPKSRKTGTIKKNGAYNVIIGEGENEITIKDLAKVFENSTESAFTRTISLALRHGTPIQFVVEQLDKGASKEDEMFSLSKGLMRVLKAYIKDGTTVSSTTKCPGCGASGSLVYQDGCMLCSSCGDSKCG